MFFIKLLNNVIVDLLSLIIRGYQVLISPVLGNNCRFNPTCSNYALLSLKKRGFLLGSLLTLKRIIKCNPLHPGGHDPIK